MIHIDKHEMSRLEDRKKRKSVVQELATDSEDLSKFVKVTFTLRKRDLNDLESYIKKVNEDGESEENATKSLAIRKALKLLYSNKKPFHKI